MIAYAVIPLTCWLASVIAAPRSPLPGNEIQEQVYMRLLGRQHLLRYLAIVATGVALLAAVLAMPSHSMPSPSLVQASRAYCTQPTTGEPACYSLDADGVWVQES